MFLLKGRAFTTSVCKKKRSVGLFTQYNSFTPFSYKIGLIKYLILKVFKISSCYIIFPYELNKITNILQNTEKHALYFCYR